MLRILRSGNKRTKIILWAVAVVTIVTFVGGFIFLFGARLDPSSRPRSGGEVGSVNGQPISALEYQNALADQREGYRQQFGSDPADRDQKIIEVQAWRSLVSQRLLASEARTLGLKAHDREVVITLESNPPQQVLRIPAFQTNGKFDPNKYRAALRDPNQSWSAVEDLVRDQLPVRKLQERLMASIKLTEPELQQAFHDRYDRLDATILQILPPVTAKVPPPTEADLARAYQTYKGRFSSGTRVQLEVLTVPKKFGTEEVRVARELAQSLVRRARAGEDFAQLAKDYSEGPGAANGGEIGRVLQSSDLGSELAVTLAPLQPGQITEPLQDQGRFAIFKVIERPAVPGSPTPGFKVAEILVRVKPNETSLRDQYLDLVKLRARAASQGLGAAAAEKGLATSRTGYFDYNNAPPQLAGTPEAADWGLTAKLHEVSGVYEGPDDFTVVQVAARHEGGAPSRDEITDQLRQICEVEARVAQVQPRADSVARDLARGTTLEAAAKARGLSTFTVTGLNRTQPDPRLMVVPEIVGRLFVLPPGKVDGPLRGLNGWYFVRTERMMPAATAAYDTLRGQISGDILQRRQQSFFSGFVAELRAKAKVEDRRNISPD
jgi:peptidyl-prolyl cis-trans isomerase D